jgi:hypothetical protein
MRLQVVDRVGLDPKRSKNVVFGRTASPPFLALLALQLLSVFESPLLVPSRALLRSNASLLI